MHRKNRFGSDLHDIRFNHMSAKDASDGLCFYTNVQSSITKLVTDKDDTPSWLSQPSNSRQETKEKQKSCKVMQVNRPYSKDEEGGKQRGSTIVRRHQRARSQIEPLAPRDEKEEIQNVNRKVLHTTLLYK